MRTSGGISVGWLLIAAALSGCGAAPPASSPAGAPEGSFVPGTRAHWMPTLRSLPSTSHAFPPPGAHLDYYGGKVIPNISAQVVFWGPGVDPTVTTQIGGYFSAVPNSRYLDWLSEYDTAINGMDGQPGSNQSIGRGGLGGTTTITPVIATGASLTDAQIQQELSTQLSAANLPPADGNTLYVAYFAPAVQITQGGGTSCSAFCGYHGTFQKGASEVFYAVIPDVATCAGACDFIPGDAFASVTAISSHEMAEAITDAEIGLATGPGRPLAWYDLQPNHGEIGDLCLALTDTIAGYSVQKEWSNSLSACITFNPAVPEPSSGGGNGCGCSLAGQELGDSSLAGALLAALAAACWALRTHPAQGVRFRTPRSR